MKSLTKNLREAALGRMRPFFAFLLFSVSAFSLALAQVKVSELPAASSATGPDLVIVTQGSGTSAVTRKATVAQILAGLSGTGYAVTWENLTGKPLSIQALESITTPAANSLMLFTGSNTSEALTIPHFSQTYVSTGSNATAMKTLLVLENVDNTSDANKPVSTAAQTALDGKQTVTWLEEDPTIFYDDFERADTVDGTLTPAPSGQTYTTTGSGAANGRIVDGRLVSVSPHGAQYHYPDLDFAPTEIGTRFSYIAASGTSSANRGLSTMIVSGTALGLTPMIHFVWDAGQWWAEIWDGRGITPVVSGTFERRLALDGTEYAISLRIDPANDRITVRTPDGMTFSGTDMAVSDLHTPHVAWEQIYNDDPVYYVRFDSIWARDGASREGPFMTAIDVDQVRANKGPGPVAFDNRLGTAGSLLVGSPANPSVSPGPASVTLQPFRTWITELASGTNAIAIGRSSSAVGLSGIGIGAGASSSASSYAMALGDSASASYTYAVAAGRLAASGGTASVAIGDQVWVSGDYSTGVGERIVNTAGTSVTLGSRSTAGFPVRDFTIADGGTTVTISGTDVTSEFTVTSGAIRIRYTPPQNGTEQTDVRTASAITYSGGNTTFTISSPLPAGITSGKIHGTKVIQGTALGSYSAVTAAINGAQIGVGTNSVSNSLQFLTNRIADASGLALAGTNGISVTKAATGVTLGIEFSGTSAAPTNTATPAAWVDTVISGTTFKWPLYQ